MRPIILKVRRPGGKWELLEISGNELGEARIRRIFDPVGARDKSTTLDQANPHAADETPWLELEVEAMP